MEQAHGCSGRGGGKELALEMQTMCSPLQRLCYFPTSDLSKCEYHHVSILEMQIKTQHHEAVEPSTDMSAGSTVERCERPLDPREGHVGQGVMGLN